MPELPEAEVVAQQLRTHLLGAKLNDCWVGRAEQTVLREAIACGGSSVKDFFAPYGTEGRYKQHHLVYGKEGEACPNRCGRIIRRLQSERSSFVCPACQTSSTPRRFFPVSHKIYTPFDLPKNRFTSLLR
jgi:formamidopyrimidine-DNA glycosylase